MLIDLSLVPKLDPVPDVWSRFETCCGRRADARATAGAESGACADAETGAGAKSRACADADTGSPTHSKSDAHSYFDACGAQCAE